MNIGEIILVVIVCILCVVSFIYSRIAEKLLDEENLKKAKK